MIHSAKVSRFNEEKYVSKAKSGQIIIVASGKGGVGKTWFSVTFAHALAMEGKKVLLFDGDLGLANIDIQLGLMPEKDLGSLTAGRNTLEEIVMSYPEGGFDIIAGRSGCGSLSNISKERLSLLEADLQRIAQKYDVLILDLGAGVGGIVKSLSNIAQQCYVVVTDEPTSLTDAYAFLKVTHATHAHLPLNVVINQAEDLKAGEHIYESLKKVCENFLRYTPGYAGSVRRDSHVKDTIRNQAPLLLRYGNCDAAQDVKNIAKKHVKG